MSGNICGCGLPHRRPGDVFCIKCNCEIAANRISVAEEIEFPSDFKSKPCKCSESARSNWGARNISGITVCNFCGLFSSLDPNDLTGLETDSAELFSDLDLPYTLDPTKPQYKVITQKDRFFSSKFNPALIERALNEYAQEGWVLKEAVSADFGSVGMSRNELILFMEKLPDGKINS